MKKIGNNVDELKKDELVALAVKLKLGEKKDLEKSTKPKLVILVKEWEAKQFPDQEQKNTSSEETTPVKEEWALGFREGKKVMSIVPKTVNEKDYNEITVEDGSTYLEPINQQV